jgi:hypothetical protein
MNLLFICAMGCGQKMSVRDEGGPTAVLPLGALIVEPDAGHPRPVTDRVGVSVVLNSGYKIAAVDIVLSTLI